MTLSTKKLDKWCQLNQFAPVIVHLNQCLIDNVVEYTFEHQVDGTFRNRLFPQPIHELFIPIPGLETNDFDLSLPSPIFQFFLKSFKMFYEIKKKDPYLGAFHCEPDDYILTLFDRKKPSGN